MLQCRKAVQDQEGIADSAAAWAVPVLAVGAASQHSRNMRLRGLYDKATSPHAYATGGLAGSITGSTSMGQQ
jgi:hypothetical protein